MFDLFYLYLHVLLFFRHCMHLPSLFERNIYFEIKPKFNSILISSCTVFIFDFDFCSILLFGNGSHLKLCDFGSVENSQFEAADVVYMDSVRYMAPEVINPNGMNYNEDWEIVINNKIKKSI